MSNASNIVNAGDNETGKRGHKKPSSGTAPVPNAPQLQYHAFVNAYPLWQHEGFFEFLQFKLPLVSVHPDLTFDGLEELFVFGKRAERFFAHAIHQSGTYELVMENVQVIQDKATLGELDFILAEKGTGQHIHVELVCKFYLYDPEMSGDELVRWIGPNRNDTLIKKLNKLREKQFPLLHHPATKASLESKGLAAEQCIQQVCFKAELFVPYHLRGKQLPLINNECIKGYWIRKNEFHRTEFEQNQFFAPEKPAWMLSPKHANTWWSYSVLLDQIEPLLERQKAPLIWMKMDNGEFEKFFLVWW